MEDARSRYVADSVATSSPARLLTMLYDRLLLDLARGEEALAAGDRVAAAPFVGHAEEVVSELISTLDEDAWDGAGSLMSIYSFVLSRLVRAGTSGDADAVAGCRRVLEPLALAWHEAADEIGRTALPAQRAADSPVPGVLGVG
jgi:flagellar protein FliS